jgi:hypothetical protein
MEFHVDKLPNNYNSTGKKWQKDAKISRQDAKLYRHQLLVG